MLQSEFYDRTGVLVGGDEWWEINRQYNAFNGNKDAFCRAWIKANPARVQEVKDRRAVAKVRGKLIEIKCELLCKYGEGKVWELKADEVLNKRQANWLKKLGLFQYWMERADRGICEYYLADLISFLEIKVEMSEETWIKRLHVMGILK